MHASVCPVAGHLERSGACNAEHTMGWTVLVHCCLEALPLCMHAHVHTAWQHVHALRTTYTEPVAMELRAGQYSLGHVSHIHLLPSTRFMSRCRIVGMCMSLLSRFLVKLHDPTTCVVAVNWRPGLAAVAQQSMV